MTDSSDRPCQSVLICQNRTCLKQGAKAVFAAFQALASPEFFLIQSGCLGQCGNGPMVKVLPSQTWYSRVQPDEVPVVVKRHLLGGSPVRAMLYPKFHPVSGKG